MRALDADRIAEAGLAVADERGATGLTIRAVTQALGVTPMALYHHVDGKAELVALVVQRAMSERPLPDPTGAGWREDLWELARWMRQRLEAHPAIAQLRRLHEVWTPAINRVADRWAAIWNESGLSPAAAPRAAVASALAILGVLEAEISLLRVAPPAATEVARLPNFRSMLSSGDPYDDFELLVRSLVDGLHANLTDI